MISISRAFVLRSRLTTHINELSNMLLKADFSVRKINDDGTTVENPRIVEDDKTYDDIMAQISGSDDYLADLQVAIEKAKSIKANDILFRLNLLKKESNIVNYIANEQKGFKRIEKVLDATKVDTSVNPPIRGMYVNVEYAPLVESKIDTKIYQKRIQKLEDELAAVNDLTDVEKYLSKETIDFLNQLTN